MAAFARARVVCIGAAALASALAASGIGLAQTNQEPAVAASPSPAAPALPPQPAPPAAFQPGFLHQLKTWWDESAAFVDRGIKGTRGLVDDLGKKSGGATTAAADAAKSAAQGAAAATENAVKNSAAASKAAASTAEDTMKDAVEATKGAAVSARDTINGAVEATKSATRAQDAMKGAVEIGKNAATAIVNLPNTRFIDMRERCVKAPNGASDCETAAAVGCRSKGFGGGHPLDVRTTEKCDTTALQAGQLPGQHACPLETVVTRALCQ